MEAGNGGPDSGIILMAFFLSFFSKMDIFSVSACTSLLIL